MKSKNVLKLLLVTLLLSVWSFNSTAQSKKIGVVFMADTTLVHQKIGLTIFENSTKPLPLHIALSGYIEKSLQNYLTPEYSINISELPDSLKNVKMGILESGIGKKLSRWANTKNGEYDIIIFIKNMDAAFGYNSSVSAKASGILTKTKSIYLYSTISYYAYDTTKEKLMGYNNKGGDFLYQLKGVNLPKDLKDLTPEMVDYFTFEFKKYINSRIEYFISKSKLMTQNEITAKLSLTPKNKDFPLPDSLKNSDDPYKDDLY